MRSPFLVVCALAIGACQEPDPGSFTTLQPEISVAPDAVVFGERAVPLTHEEVIFVSNAGRVDLELEMSIQGDDAGVYDLTNAAAVIEPGSNLPVAVRFAPTTFLPYEATLLIVSNDEDNGTLEVPISGTGVPAPMPDIQLSALSLDFGTVPQGTEVQEFLVLSNIGAETLQLGEVSIAGSGAFSLPVSPRNATLAAGNQQPLIVTYAPDSDIGDSGVLSIRSNDPDEDLVEVVLLGNGGADFEYPTAVIDCPGIVNPPALVRLDGADSVNPMGGDLSYTWTLLAVPSDPASGVSISDAEFTSTVGSVTNLDLDAVGTYLVSLVVENDVGIRSAAALCEVQAIPSEELLIELTWNESNADLDLHLAEDGAVLFEEPGDANWCNGSPSWGGSGSADDPSLNIDDRAGYGPENISIEFPSDGRYDVRVHYFADQGDDTVQATVRVYIDGDLAPGFPVSELLERNEVWDVARVNWPERTAALLGTVGTAANRNCFTP